MVSLPRTGLADTDQFGPEGLRRGSVQIAGSKTPFYLTPGLVSFGRSPQVGPLRSAAFVVSGGEYLPATVCFVSIPAPRIRLLCGRHERAEAGRRPGKRNAPAKRHRRFRW